MTMISTLEWTSELRNGRLCYTHQNTSFFRFLIKCEVMRIISNSKGEPSGGFSRVQLLDEKRTKYSDRMNLTDKLELPRGKIRYLAVID
jgi:hypothetical protein